MASHGMASRTAWYPTRHGIPHGMVSHTAWHPARHGMPQGQPCVRRCGRHKRCKEMHGGGLPNGKARSPIFSPSRCSSVEPVASAAPRRQRVSTRARTWASRVGAAALHALCGCEPLCDCRALKSIACFLTPGGSREGTAAARLLPCCTNAVWCAGSGCHGRSGRSACLRCPVLFRCFARSRA
jgi:hypothetical protein